MENENKKTPQNNFSQDALKKAQDKMVEMRLSGWKPEVLNPVERALRSPNSPKAAIRAMCWTCEGQYADPHVKLRVANCAVGEKCPLYPHRPWQHLKGKMPGIPSEDEAAEDDISSEGEE